MSIFLKRIQDRSLDFQKGHHNDDLSNSTHFFFHQFFLVFYLQGSYKVHFKVVLKVYHPDHRMMEWIE